LGEQSFYEDFGKIVKPITEQQQKSSEEIVSKFAPLQEAIENMSPALLWGQAESEAVQALPESPLPINIDQLAKKYLVNLYGNTDDKTFGLDNRSGQFFLGNTEVDFEGNDLVIGGKGYAETRGLWDLLVMKRPVVGLATEEGKKNYEEIMVETGAMRNRKNPQKPAVNRGYKWETFIRPIWEKHLQKPKKKVKRQQKKTQGQGFLPSDPNALCERLELLMASNQAGNTGLRNGIVSICDELLRPKICPVMLIKT